MAANIDTGLSHFQPMVAILCGHGKYHNQYLDENKKWISDPDPKAVCTKDKLEILEYCRKVFVFSPINNLLFSLFFLMFLFGKRRKTFYSFKM